MISVCAVIPCYNHAAVLADIVRALLNHVATIIIVDDGSNAPTREALEQLQRHYQPALHLHRLEPNAGKGAAVMAGLRIASERGFTHALQIDADGQHDTTDIPLLIEHARTFPTRLITGIPVYDESVNKTRFIARYVTHFWVWVNTLSLSIRDSMCGFRIYPLQVTLAVMDKYRIGRRMDFDTDIMVRMYWEGVQVVNVPTRVRYPQGGSSNFRLWRDNVLISRMHARLFSGMLRRAPGLLVRKLRGADGTEQHWSRQQEKGTYLGLRTLLLIYRWFGRTAFSLLLHPVILFFFLFSPQKRAASRKYLRHLHRHAGSPGKLRWYHSYAHFIAFGHCVLDKLISWMDNTLQYNRFEGADEFARLEQSQSGAVFIGSHLGNLEYCRALSRTATSKVINAVVYTEHAANFNRVLKEVNPGFDVNLIHVRDFGVDTAIRFREKIERGEILVIVADRTSPTAVERDVQAGFLGEQACFPQGPFILASLMACPVYLLFCLKEKGGYNIYLERFRDRIALPRGRRREALQQIVQDYAHRLEHYCHKAPLQWFNFFDFWAGTQK